MPGNSLLLRRPHLLLAAGVTGMLAAEMAYRQTISIAWLLVQWAIALAALLVAWRAQEQLRLVSVLVLALALQAALVGVHLWLGADADVDTSVVFQRWGDLLLAGDYPRAEYPTGGVLLFGLEAALGDTRVANAFLMIPFQLLLVASLWALRTRRSAWLATLVALWPANAYYWEFKYDLAPAALLALGLVLALRGRWGWSGVALGVGTALKWTPALGFLALAGWLLVSGRRSAARGHALAFAAVLALVHLPFLLWEPEDVAVAYTRQGDRPITAESVWYLLLRPLDLVELRGHVSFPAGAPGWANVAATAVQVALVLAVLAVAARARNPRAAVALAALAPAVFLLTNRIFSPQFLVPILAAWAIATALVARGSREQLAAGLAAMAATGANAFVYPFALPFYDITWPLASVTLFLVGFALTGRLAWQAAREDERRRKREDHERVEVVEDHRQVEEVGGHGADERGGEPPRKRAHARGERIAGRGERPADSPRGA
jgi:Glycosyltransferase family 87